jgi:TRAP-type C4-dicarboxylate transport system permease small subunit
MGVLVLLTVGGVFMRYVIGHPFTWLEEIQLLLIIWVAFFGASAAFRSGSHIAIEIITDMFPIKVQKIVEVFVSILVFCIIAYIMWLEFRRGLDLLETGRRTNILQIPLSMNYFGVAAACLLMLVNFVRNKIGSFRSAPVKKEGAEQ